jgi:hypothetical protein
MSNMGFKLEKGKKAQIIDHNIDFNAEGDKPKPRMMMTPTVKYIIGAGALSTGAYSIYNAFNATELKWKAIHGVAGGVLVLIGGWALIDGIRQQRNGIALTPTEKTKQSSSGVKENYKVAPETKKAPEVINIPKNTAASLSLENTSNVDGTADINQQQKKIDKKYIEWANGKKRAINKRLSELKEKLKALPKNFQGHQKGLGMRNEMALLNTQLRLI